MKCPACFSEMKTVKAGDIEVDVCAEGCGGIWFDAGELDKFDDGQEFDPQSVVDVRITKDLVDTKQIRRCPRCEGQALVRQFYDVQNKVEMNQCWNCGGIFLDRGELAILRSEYPNDEAHKKAVEDYAEKCVAEQAKKMSAETAQWKQRYEDTHATRFECAMRAFKKLITGSED